ncbi:LysR family transcriptional regulator [Siculibacillus lacustris]|uniref:LysR family transcriptional regulator n=1 Tax=Siculibacillus lacustris TaxID=1549641 RepID=A0A4Q9VTL0_9HYPH|nr:LysR family transcriptional regulator [Siculibacillus lacustris]TBW39448.1 LysR family transcriptional regulator [Siculibacillus lacustris]
MDRKRLISFLALSEELHFDRAALRCHMTQPAMSQHLRALEEQIGAKLVYRTKRHVSLTRAGEAFVQEARHIVAHMDRAADLARRIEHGTIGELTVGVTTPALYILFPEIVAAFAREQPQVNLVCREMTTAEQEEALLAHAIDVGIVHPPVVDDALICREITRIPFDVVLPSSHRLAAEPKIRLADLARERFILFPRRIGPRLYDGILGMCAEVGVSPESVIETYPAQSIVAMAACGFGVGFIASEVQHFIRPMATFRTLDGPAPQMTVGVAYHRETMSPLISALVRVAVTVGETIR